MSEPPASQPSESPPVEASAQAAAEVATEAAPDTESAAEAAAAPAPAPTPPAAPAGVERRASDRRPMRSQAVVVLPGPREFPVRTVDISATGMGIVAAANPAAGTTFTIRFALPTKAKTAAVQEANARVVHSVFSSDEDGFKIGLLFTQLTPNCAAAIVQYIGETTVR